MIGDEAVEVLEDRQVEAVGTFESHDVPKALPEQAQGGHDAVELEVLVAAGSRAVMVVGELPVGQGQVRLAVAVLDDGLGLVALL